MPLLFFAAGCVYKEKPILADIKHRVRTIVIPYFSFGLLVLIYWQLIERRFRDSDLGFAESVFGLVSGEYDYLDFNVHLWFLPCFFVTVVLFNILINIGERFRLGKMLAYIVAFAMSFVYIRVQLPAMPWGFERVFEYIVFYVVGTAFAGTERIEGKIGQDRKLLVIAMGIALLAVNYVLAYCGATIGIMWYVTALIGIASVVILSMTIDRNSVLEYLGRITLVILCVHGPIYRILIKLISIPAHMSTDAVRSSGLLAFIVVALTVLACSIVYEFVARILPWMIGKKAR